MTTARRGSFLGVPETAARAVDVSQVSCVPHFPMINSSNIGNAIKKMCNETEFFDMENTASSISAAVGCCAAGGRTFVPLSGLTTSIEVLTAAFLRMPFVCLNVSRFVETFTNLPGHNSLADSGWLVFYAETNQDIIDSIIQLYKICEDKKVMLPSIVNIFDASQCSNVQIPTSQSVDKYLPKFKIHHGIDLKTPSFIGYPGADLDEMRNQQMKAMENALHVTQHACEKWKEKFRRGAVFFDSYMIEDAEAVILSTEFLTAKATVDLLRKEGEKIGLIKLHVFRPFPAEQLKKVLDGKRVGIIDRDAYSNGGLIYNDVKQCCGFCVNYIYRGDISERQYAEIFKHLKKAEKGGTVWLK